jgi:transcription termination factor NusB
VLLGVLAGPVDDAAQAVHQAADRVRLDDNDRRLAFQLTHLVLRHATYLDALYYRYFNEAPERLRMESRVILRLAMAQKALLDRIPDHAIGDESVRLARQFFRLREGEVSFLNAIVRRICEHPSYQPDLADLDRPVDRYEDKSVAPLAEAARRSSCPDWIVGLLGDCLGASAWHELPRIINGEAPVVLRANLLRTTREQLAADL